MFGVGALILVVAGLLATVLVQVWPSHRFAGLFDLTAIIPQWRFYALPSQGGAADVEKDFHLIVRDRDASGATGAWRPVLWNGERRWIDALWNPGRYRRDALLSHCQEIARRPDFATSERSQQSIPYLILLRCALGAPGGEVDAVQRQFAIVHTRGRGDRAVAVDFVSGFHSC